MKNIKRFTFLTLFIFISVSGIGQNRFDEFSVNDSVGIVEIENLDEFMEPSIIFQKKININPNYLTFRENDSIKIFSKLNGKWRKSLYIGESYPVFEINEKSYLSTIVNNKTAIFNSDLKLIFSLTKKYENVRSLPGNFFFALNNDQIDIYKFDLKKSVLMHSIRAKDYLKRKKYYDSGSSTEYLFFFGGEQTFQYDLNFKLLKQIDKKFMNSYELDEYLRSKSQTAVMATNKGPNYSKKNINLKEFLLIEKEDKNKFCSKSSLFNIITDVNFELKSENSQEFIVYKVFTRMKNGIELKSMGSANSYRFTIQGINPKILLPLKYQKEIGIQIEKKS